MSTKNEKLIRELKRRWLTPLDALQSVGTMKLATRVGEIREAMVMRGLSQYTGWAWFKSAVQLREDGFSLVDKWVETPGGRKVKAYRLGHGSLPNARSNSLMEDRHSPC